jgi:hypothetical protein
MSELSNATPDASTPTRPKKNHAWIYFFVFIFVASIGATVLMIQYNRSIQLKPEQLEDARNLWKEKGPKNYNMVYTKKLNDESKVDKFAVEVRNGNVTSVLMNGKPLEKETDAEQDPRIFHSMDQHFRYLERFMELDKKPGAPKVFVTAIFDDETGALRRYIRRVSGLKLRIEMHITVTVVEK